MMIPNLFNMFDPSTKLINPFMINSMLIILMMKSNLKNKLSSPMNIMKNMMMEMLTEKKKPTTMNKMMISLMTLILILNLMSLSPFSWSSTSQFSNNLPITMLFMFMITTKILMKKKKSFMIHLIPIGTPNYLIPFMFMIELISWLIRPITLIMRLTANMISGHMLIHLIYSIPMSSKMMTTKISSIIMSSPLMMLEFMVAIVQAIIISYLINMYNKEN